MPRFFFNHRSQDNQNEVDIEGLKLTSLHEAIEEAAFAAKGAVALAEEPVSGEFMIEDEGRVLLARVPYVARVEGEAETPAEPDLPKSS
ncbi:hypothetical protein VW35_11025 [Devosia soli]|uniref:DUF6894 domain-containing protein n=1 Tax=Devosia soli TaxID=361041 RepID=A0A0F5L772_9HYPH|nr:hypothetical protein [Devosia soli]KKB78193.1 hypothetical protein VW35_11025 [Devosia soli]